MPRKARIDNSGALHHIILDTVEARGVLAVRELGLTTLELSKRVGVSQPTISQSVKRGERIVKRKDLKISENISIYEYPSH
jgi:hypothetical protein